MLTKSDNVCYEIQKKPKQEVYLHFIDFIRKTVSQVLWLYKTITDRGGWQSQTN